MHRPLLASDTFHHNRSSGQFTKVCGHNIVHVPDINHHAGRRNQGLAALLAAARLGICVQAPLLMIKPT